MYPTGCSDNNSSLGILGHRWNIYANALDAASINTKSLSSKANSVNKSSVDLDVDYNNNSQPKFKEGSMAAKANLVKDFNERNSRK